MSLRDDVAQAGARIVRHSDNWMASFWGSISQFGGVEDFATHFWITLYPDICMPDVVKDPYEPQWETAIRHELVHIKQQRGHLFSWLFGYLASQKFRWEQEREAYLVDIRAGARTPEQCAKILSTVYRISKPTPEQMVAWFKANA